MDPRAENRAEPSAVERNARTFDLNLHAARRRRIQHDIRPGSHPIESCCRPLAPSCTGRAIDISTPHSLSAESRARERTLNNSSLANRIRRVASSISDRFRLALRARSFDFRLSRAMTSSCVFPRRRRPLGGASASLRSVCSRNRSRERALLSLPLGRRSLRPVGPVHQRGEPRASN